ncbi:hypothetical protein EYR36_011441 [Pleurotus pulmonarius]|nr:hypothetical protein EYR36_011441 [Pleurotus pulmonarius]
MTYIGDCVFIKKVSPSKVQAFVSSDSGGRDSWYTLTDSFESGKWVRFGWDVIVLRDEEDTWRRGVYMHIKGVTVYITVRSFDDIRVEYAQDRRAPISAITMPFFPEFDLHGGHPDSRIRRPSSQPYIGDCVLIRNASNEQFQAFVSSHNGGSKSWFALTKSFKDGRWGRSGWEVVVCRNAEDTWRKGVYVHIKGVTVYVTVKGVDQVEIEYGRERVEPERGRGDVETKRGERCQSDMTEVNVAPLVSTFQERDAESQKDDDESETLYNGYQPLRYLGRKIFKNFGGWA